MLYANIHYNSGSNENSFSSPTVTTAQNYNPFSRNVNSNKDIEADRRNSGSRKQAKRYWTNNAPNTSNPRSFAPFFKEKQSGVYKQPKANAVIAHNDANEPAQKAENNASTPIVPKQFTPYVSFLPFNDSTSNLAEAEIPVARVSENESTSKMSNTRNEVQRRLTAPTKNINPFSKKHTIDSYKKMFDGTNASLATEHKSNENSNKRLNPFNPLSKKAKRKKSEANENQRQKKSVPKNRAELKSVTKTGERVENISVIDVDVDDDKDDDDDVIILPTQAPPLICVDDSDDEITPTNTQDHEFTEPNAVTDSNRKATRCASPSSSIQSADDFIAQNDQRNFGFETFGTLSDDDLCQVSETVESELRNKSNEPGTSKRADLSYNDNAIFTPPKQMQTQKEKVTKSSMVKKSYEVAANSFAAVDVYESESSDMPDSIYAKGAANKRKQIIDSDSSVESVSVTKSKRLRKRKSSGSAKESDKHSDESSSSDLPEIDDDDSDDDDETPNENSYLVRGEALGKVKNSNNKKKNTKKQTDKFNETNDKFINKLSDILRGQNESDENDDIENTQETSTESVAARDIVETVLQRRTKKSKKKQSTEINENPAENEPETPNAWEITDQIGETDDLNIGRIFDETGTNTSTDVEKTQSEQDNNSNVQQIESNQQQSNELNEPSDANDDANEEDCMIDEENSHKSEICWNDEMRRFYNDSWGGETFSVRNIRARMPSK